MVKEGEKHHLGRFSGTNLKTEANNMQEGKPHKENFSEYQTDIFNEVTLLENKERELRKMEEEEKWSLLNTPIDEMSKDQLLEYRIMLKNLRDQLPQKEG